VPEWAVPPRTFALFQPVHSGRAEEDTDEGAARLDGLRGAVLSLRDTQSRQAQSVDVGYDEDTSVDSVWNLGEDGRDAALAAWRMALV
jgi:hypothetical protein